LRANLSAASFASVPELAKKTRSAKEQETSVAASCAAGAVWYRLLVCASSAACDASAVCQPMSLWPRQLTAMPEVKSRYSFPDSRIEKTASPPETGRRAFRVVQQAALAVREDNLRARVRLHNAASIVRLFTGVSRS
jgi:hypothetical protein